VLSSNELVFFFIKAEVVEMNPAEAIAANLARLSYSASLRAKAALRRAASKLSVAQVFFTYKFKNIPIINPFNIS